MNSTLYRYEQRRDFRFDHVGVALLTLFQVLTTEGWPQVRNLFDSEPVSTRSPQSWVSECSMLAHNSRGLTSECTLNSTIDNCHENLLFLCR